MSKDDIETVITLAIIFGILFGIFGLGIGLIYLSFLQAIGCCLVSGVIGLPLGMIFGYIIYRP